MNQQYHRMYRQTVIFRILSADAPFNLAAEEALNSIYMFNYDAEQYKAGEYLDMEKKAIKLEEAFIAAARNAVGVAVEKKATTRRASRD